MDPFIGPQARILYGLCLGVHGCRGLNGFCSSCGASWGLRFRVWLGFGMSEFEAWGIWDFAVQGVGLRV